eukprot:scaffold238563_cov31-Tisochrysis_lutea.AAC.4
MALGPEMPPDAETRSFLSRYPLAILHSSRMPAARSGKSGGCGCTAWPGVGRKRITCTGGA